MNARARVLGCVLLLISLACYGSFLHTGREQFWLLLSLYGILFLASAKAYQLTVETCKSVKNTTDLPASNQSISYLPKSVILALIAVGIVFRLLPEILQITPNLSPDWYRFLWDGMLSSSGISPYGILPVEYDTSYHPDAEVLNVLRANLTHLNASNYTSYGIVNQLQFAIAAWVGQGEIWIMALMLRLQCVAADLGTLWALHKLLPLVNLPRWKAWLWWFCPFVIIELNHNLHFEGSMVFLLLLGLYWLHKRKTYAAGLSVAASILIKLTPLLTLPALWKSAGLKRGLLFCITVGVFVLVGFAGLVLGPEGDAFLQSVGLWFGTFEFNASIYYVIRWIGYQATGYNIIGITGKLLPLVAAVVIFVMGFVKKNDTLSRVACTLLFSYCVYLLLATTVHPWYLAIPLALSLLTRYRFMLVWSFLVFLSYAGYSLDGYEENLWLVALEYLVVFGFAVWEITKAKNQIPENKKGLL